VVLVTEPTPFGHHDLTLAVATVRRLDYPFGVIINRDGVGDDRIQLYCQKEEIPLLGVIPNNRHIAAAYAEGVLAIEADSEMAQRFAELGEAILQLARGDSP
jgi:MinD superfamily P-loop ATPase